MADLRVMRCVDVRYKRPRLGRVDLVVWFDGFPMHLVGLLYRRMQAADMDRSRQLFCAVLRWASQVTGRRARFVRTVVGN